ncbi:MAG: glycosyltransferase family 4 protein [Armatimonadetes bacterium]|nr:glycosyltransferase family 4 protein [Armatimonadota bacterium]
MRLAIWVERLTARDATVVLLELVPALVARGVEVAVLGRPGSLAPLFEEAGARVFYVGPSGPTGCLIALRRLLEFRPDVVWTHGEKVLEVASPVMSRIDALFIHHVLLTDAPLPTWQGRSPDCFLAWWLVLAHRLRERGLRCQDLRVPVRVRSGEPDDDAYAVLVCDYAPEHHLHLVSIARRAAMHLTATSRRPVKLCFVRPVSDASEEWPGDEASQLNEGLVSSRQADLRTALFNLARHHAAFGWGYAAMQMFAAGVPVYCGHPEGIGVGPLTRHDLFLGMTLYPLDSKPPPTTTEEEWLAEAVRYTRQQREAQRAGVEELLGADACVDKLMVVVRGAV